VYARNFGLDPAEAERIMTERVGAVLTREAFWVDRVGCERALFATKLSLH
jgi:hypothetical protein